MTDEPKTENSLHISVKLADQFDTDNPLELAQFLWKQFGARTWHPDDYQLFTEWMGRVVEAADDEEQSP